MEFVKGRLDKHVISQYLHTKCKRQFKLSLYSGKVKEYTNYRKQEGMPPEFIARPGLELVTQMGREYEQEVYTQIIENFPRELILSKKNKSEKVEKLELKKVLFEVKDYSMILQGSFDLVKDSSFEQLLGISYLRKKIEYSAMIPDIIVVMPNGYRDRAITPDGRQIDISGNDTRQQLLVIDIKHTAEPSIAHYSEVAYYMMMLASWLKDIGFDNRYVVVEGAIWPGMHKTSSLQTNINKEKEGVNLTPIRMIEWMYEDMIIIPHIVYTSRLKNFFKFEIDDILDLKWHELEYHVNVACRYCDYLGYPWTTSDGKSPHKEHCMPRARSSNHLSMVPYLSEGAALSLKNYGINDINMLRALDFNNEAFEKHQFLKANRVRLPARANSLIENEIIHLKRDLIGAAISFPKWADLSIDLTIDFDISSGITAAIGVSCFMWNSQEKEPMNLKSEVTTREIFTVPSRDIKTERRQFIGFLIYLKKVLDAANKLAEDAGIKKPRYQIYIWDTIQYEHLCKLVGRHLGSIIGDPGISELAWLFPSDELLTRESYYKSTPITIVSSTINQLSAMPIAHHYSMLDVARAYLDNEGKKLSIHPHFEDRFSDQIPSERIHEIWTESVSPPWITQVTIFKETVEKKLIALSEIRRNIVKEHGETFTREAPIIASHGLKNAGKMSIYGELLYAYTMLNSRLEEMKIQNNRALPSHEKEANFSSALLTKLVEGREKKYILGKHNIEDNSKIRVYKLSNNSLATKIKEGDFTYSLSPGNAEGFLNISLRQLIKEYNLDSILDLGKIWNMFAEEVSQVQVLAINLELLNPYIILEENFLWDNYFFNGQSQSLIQILEAQGLDFSNKVMLEERYFDIFSKRLKNSLQVIGNPKIASTDPRIIKAMGYKGKGGRSKSTILPAARYLWDSEFLNQKSHNAINLSEMYESLKLNPALNDSQKDAWGKSMTDRVTLIWGPPGTGKTKTINAIFEGLIKKSQLNDKPVKILVSAFTYTALDNMLIPFATKIKKEYSEKVEIYRLRSSMAPIINDKRIVEYDKVISSSTERQNFSKYIKETSKVIFMFTSSQQAYRLSEDVDFHGNFFDYLIIDEASQMDVANAILLLNILKENSSIVLAGDHLQLPPIHPGEYPIGLESVLGSIFDYYRDYHKIEPVMLNINYRSNEDIVRFTNTAGYSEQIKSFFPDLRLNLHSDNPNSLFADYEKHNEGIYDLALSSEVIEILLPDFPVCCFVYDDTSQSGQWNDFETELVAALTLLLHGNLCKSTQKKVKQEAYGAGEFWTQGLGIVTPHRSQRSRIVARISSLFRNETELINAAVDTVERFQGQERDIIIASYGLGDIDTIKSEDEFILDLNRFNVLTSRAKSKIIVLISRQLVNYLSSDIDIVKSSVLMKSYVESYCNEGKDMKITYSINKGTKENRCGQFRYFCSKNNYKS